MVAENGVVELAQGAAAHEAEIGDVFLVETGVGPPLVLTAAGYQADLAHEFLFRDAVAGSRVAGAKYGSAYAVSGCRMVPQVRLLPHALAKCGGLLLQPGRLPAFPFHCFSSLPAC